MTTASKQDRVVHKPGDRREGVLVRRGLANSSERWFPQPLVFAFIGITVTQSQNLCYSAQKTSSDKPASVGWSYLVDETTGRSHHRSGPGRAHRGL